MATTTTVPEGLEARALEDWRVGLVEPEPGHVFGKTALTQQEWRKRAHACDEKGLRFVMVSSRPGSDFVSTARFWAAAQCDLASVLRLAPRELGPFGVQHVRVLELSEWERIQRRQA